MANPKWPKPTAFIVQRAMAADHLRWTQEPEALKNIPLYTKEQVERLLRAHGVRVGACGAEKCGTGCADPMNCQRPHGVMACDGIPEDGEGGIEAYMQGAATHGVAPSFWCHEASHGRPRCERECNTCHTESTDPCDLSQVSSRVCERGTKGCTATHGVDLPVGGKSNG